jgi:hypothetical protein
LWYIGGESEGGLNTNQNKRSLEMEKFIVIINNVQRHEFDSFESASRVAANECVKGNSVTIQYFVNDELIDSCNF